MPTITDLYMQLFGRDGTAKGTDIDMSEHGRAGGVSTGHGFKYVGNISVATKITESGTTTYVAKANPNTAQSDASWQAFKIDESSGLVITWADGNDNFDNAATDLTALSYS